MKKILTISAFVLFCLLSCSSPYEKNYFIQQQNRSSKDGGNGGGVTGGWEDDEIGGGDAENLPQGTLSMFAVLQKDGTLEYGGLTFEAAAVSELKAKLAGGSEAAGSYATDKFNAWQVRSTFSGSNVPNLWYEGGTASDSYSGPNSSAGSNSITNMMYYRYKGYNPLFGKDSSYNTAEYTKADGSTKEKIMDRFEFYRFTGKGGGVAALDNFLVAVDTYTKLVFAFAKPTKSESLLGQQVPKEWGPVDLVSTGPGGKKYKFYEYDPAGYVDANGKFVMAKWYTDGMGRGNYDPQFTGVSPYLGTMGGTGGGTGVGGGYPVTGILTVRAKYLRNDSMTDAWGDHGNADDTDSPEFIYDIRSRAYDGFDLPAWDSLSSYKPSDTGMSPRSALIIKKGSTRSLGGVKQYLFENTKKDLALELDSRIVEIDVSGNDWVTEYETPIVYFSYDRKTQTWKPSIDNKTFLNGPVLYDKNFSVRAGEEPEPFLITLPAGGGQRITLCYEFQWESVANSAGGKIVSAELINNTPADESDNSSFEFSSEEYGKYTIEFIDYTQESAAKPKTVTLLLQLGNMNGVNKAVTVAQNSSSLSITGIKLNGTPVMSTTCYNDNNTVAVEFTLAEASTVSDKTGTIQFTFNYADGYDTENSPKDFTLTAVRHKYLAPSEGTFAVSNVKLKNISLQDVGGDPGGYNDPEFFWNIRTRKNTENWIEYSRRAESSATYISVGKTIEIPGSASYALKTDDSGRQRIYFDAEITERDKLANNDNDIVSKFSQPALWYEYNPQRDIWQYKGETYNFFYTNADMRWELKKIDAPDIKRGETVTMTVTLSSYIADTIWPAGNIADWIGGPKPAGWGDMELSFDVEWKN